MNTSIALSPIQFHGQSLLATLVNGIPHVALKPICENIGLDWSSQVQKIKRHPILSKGMVIITTPSNGGLQEMLMLPLKMLNGWLFGVDSSRVRPEIKDRVIEYQEECFDVLANHFMPKPQYGLKSLPASPYVNPKEKLQLRLAIEAHCAKSGDSHRAVWLKLNRAYHVNTLELLPTGKVPEMLAYLGLRVPEIDEMVLVPQRKLLALENKAKALPNQVVMTQAELLAHDEQVAEEAVKRVQGELVNEPIHNSLTLALPPLPKGETVKRFFVTQYDNEVRWGVIKEGYYFDKSELKAMTFEKMSALIA